METLIGLLLGLTGYNVMLEKNHRWTDVTLILNQIIAKKELN